MDKLNFQQKRTAAERIWANSRLAANSELRNDGSPSWNIHRTDPSEYFRNGGEGWKDRIMNYFDVLHKRGDTIVYVDICGTADGAKIGADKSYAFSLRTPNTIEKRTDRVFFEGDLFSKKDLQKFMRELVHNENRPAFVTFEPSGGFFDRPGIYSANISSSGLEVGREKTLLVYSRLASNLKTIIGTLKPGGFILVGFFEMDYMKRTDVETIKTKIASIAQHTGCSFEAGASIGSSNRYLIRKSDTIVE